MTRCGIFDPVRRAARSALPCAAFAGLLAVCASDVPAAMTPLWNAGASSISATHDPDGPGGTAPFSVGMALPSGGAALNSPFNAHTTSIPGGSTVAKAGSGRSQSSNVARILFPTGTGIDQLDPAHSTSASTLVVSFNFVWDINTGTLGPPINGTFSVPVGAKVGTGGFASFACDIHWDARINGSLMTDRRSPFSTSVAFNTAGTHLTTVTAPASSFSPTSIPSGGDDDQIIIRGTLSFSANNDDQYSVIEILGKTPSPNFADPNDSRSGPASNFENEINANPEFAMDAGSAFDEVPEPGSIGLAAMAALGLLTRRLRSSVR